MCYLPPIQKGMRATVSLNQTNDNTTWKKDLNHIEKGLGKGLQLFSHFTTMDKI